MSISIDTFSNIEDNVLKGLQTITALCLTRTLCILPFHHPLCFRHHACRMSFDCQLLIIGNGDQLQVNAMPPAIWSEKIVTKLRIECTIRNWQTIDRMQCWYVHHTKLILYIYFLVVHQAVAFDLRSDEWSCVLWSMGCYYAA